MVGALGYLAWAFQQSPVEFVCQDRGKVGAASQKLVLMALANRANGEDGTSFPRVATLVTDTLLSERVIRRALEALAGQGLVEVTRRKRGDGTQRASLYRLMVQGVAMTQPPATVAPQELPTELPTKDQNLAPAARKRDYLFESVLKVCSISPDQVTASMRGGLNRACRDIREVWAPDEWPYDEVYAEVARRASNYATFYPQAALTPSALAKHWGQIGNPKRPIQSVAEPHYFVAQEVDEEAVAGFAAAAAADPWSARKDLA